MVSARKFLLTTALAYTASAQDLPQQAFKDNRTQPPGLTQPATQPQRALSPEMRGDIFMARKMYREAVETYSQGPKNSAVLTNKLGIAYHQMLELDTAKKHYERAIKLDPNYSEAINNLGTVHYAKKSYRRAVNQYKKALKISPNSASIHSNLGTAWFARKKYKEAAEEYDIALKLDPEVFEHRNSHGVLLQERSVAERAKFHFYLSRTYAKSGHVERALIYMRKALEEGFKDKNKFREEPEFARLQDLPEFQQLLAMEARVL